MNAKRPRLYLSAPRLGTQEQRVVQVIRSRVAT